MVPKKNRRVRVLFFLQADTNLRYGVSNVFLNILNGLDRQEYEAYLVITGAVVETATKLPKDFPLIQMKQKGLRSTLKPLIKCIDSLEPDIVVSAMEHPNALSVMARLFSRHRYKLVLTSHNMFSSRLKHMWSRAQALKIRLAVQATYPLATHLVCVSNAVRDDLRGFVKPFPPSSVIFNPVFSKAAPPDSVECRKKEGMLVTSSRLAGFKAIDEAIRALSLLEDKFRLVILGDGPERGRLRLCAEENGVVDRVTFEGYVDDPFEYYRQAQVLVHPSRWEGFGNVLIESMACGCQVVANGNAGAPAEILGHGKYGFLYKGGDAQDLARAVIEACERPKPMDQLAAYARGFSDQQAAKHYASLFDDLVGQR